MKAKKNTKAFGLVLLAVIPALTILTALGGAKLILTGVFPEDKQNLIACVATGLVGLVLSMFGAYRAKQKKFIWGMLLVVGYAALLLLSNLFFFGEGYGEILPNLTAILAGGLIGSLLGGGKRRKTKRT